MFDRVISSDGFWKVPPCDILRMTNISCPHADGRRVICKHTVALFFTAFPDEAEQYIEGVEEYEREEQARTEKYYTDLR